MPEEIHDDVSDQVYHDGHRLVRRVAEKKPTAGGAHAFYECLDATAPTLGGPAVPKDDILRIGSLDFQHDTIPAVGVQGWTNEAVLAVVIDRLEGFQAGEFACEANARALDHAKEALGLLEQRTRDRKARGVEGEHKQ